MSHPFMQRFHCFSTVYFKKIPDDKLALSLVGIYEYTYGNVIVCGNGSMHREITYIMKGSPSGSHVI
jgi:hypothetical protein